MPPKNLNEWKIIAAHLEKPVEGIINCWNDLSEDKKSNFENLFSKYRKGIPIDYLIPFVVIGKYRFSLNLITLIPRPETEELIKIINDTPHKPSALIDVGCGSGLIGISVAEYFNEVIISDISKEALDVCRSNCELNGINNCQIIHSDLLTNIPTQLDFWLVANLPYVPLGDKPKEDEYNTTFEPDTALYSGSDGLDLFRILITQISQLDQKPFRLFFELDPRNISLASDLVEEIGYHTSIASDSGGFDRFLLCSQH